MPDRVRIVVAVEELEAAAAAAERALAGRDHAAFDLALADQRRLHHEIALLGDAETDPVRYAAVESRVRAVIAFREAQIRKLSAYRDSIEQRLSTMSRWNAYVRSGSNDATPVAASVIDSSR